MSRWRRTLILAALGGSLGCGVLPKSNNVATRPPLNDRLPANGELTRRANANGVLAGQVIDVANQRRPGTSLSVQPLDGGPAVEAVTNDQGYFTINGLQAGKKYKVVARAKSGELQSVGSAEVTAPNVVVMIKLSETRGGETDVKPTGLSSGVGGVHSSIAGPDEPRVRPAAPGRSDRLGPLTTDVNPPASTPQPPINSRLGRPTTEPGSNPTVQERPEYVARDNATPVTPRDTLAIAGPTGPMRSESPPPRAEPAAPSPFLDFPLQDLDLRPTSLAAYRGKVTLVDIWNTGCIPCIQAMPELMRLQRTYGPRGLVVVGIAARETGTPETVAATVRWRGGKQGVDYPLLLEQEGKSVLPTFQVQSFPTLILLDDQGREVWRGVGLTPGTKRQLETELQRRLQ